MKNLLREIRISKNLTQQDLADMVQVSRQSIISIESNRYTPSILLSLKIAKAMGKSVEEIFQLEKND